MYEFYVVECQCVMCTNEAGGGGAVSLIPTVPSLAEQCVTGAACGSFLDDTSFWRERQE